MKATYDSRDDVLYISDGRPHVVGDELMRHPGTVLHLTDDDGPDIAAITITGASAFLPLQRGYDPSSDTLTIGETVDDPELVSHSGDFVGYWEIDQALDGFRCPIGVSIHHASEHLAPAIESLPEPLEILTGPEHP